MLQILSAFHHGTLNSWLSSTRGHRNGMYLSALYVLCPSRPLATCSQLQIERGLSFGTLSSENIIL